MATSDIADVLIIGSGASGGPFAWSLSQVPASGSSAWSRATGPPDPRSPAPRATGSGSGS